MSFDAPPEIFAEAVGLTYVHDHDPGITRRRSGKGFAYRGPDGAPLQAGQIAWIDPAAEAPGDADRLPLRAGAQPLRAALFSGRPIPEPVVAHGPFVMNTQDEIRQAFADYHNGTFVEG